MSELRAVRLSKRYRDVVAVKNVSVRFSPGEVTGLLGPNGAGKTTTFHMLIGLVRPDSGSVSIDGTEVTGLPIHRRARLGLGYLPQEPSIFRDLSVEDNLRAVLEYLPISEDERGERFQRVVRDFKLESILKSAGYALSGGERRRVEIARILTMNPRFMLLDEPFAGIDPVKVDAIKEEIIRLKGQGIGVVITDHNVRELLGITDRAYLINEGEVMLEGDSQEIIGDPRARKFYLGERFKLD